MTITKIAGKEICTGQHFWIWMSIFTGSTLFITIYSYILMPETHGLSLQEIQQLYKPIPDKVASQLSFKPPSFLFFCDLNQFFSAQDKKRAIRRRGSTFFGSLPNDNLVAADDEFGDDTVPDEAKIDRIKKKLQSQQSMRSTDMYDDAIFNRRASTISGVIYQSSQKSQSNMSTAIIIKTLFKFKIN